MITFEVADIFYSSAISLKISLSMAHRDEIIVASVEEKAWDCALGCRLDWIQGIKVESSRGLTNLHDNLWPHHLHDCLGGHTWHHFRYKPFCYFFENGKRAVNDHARDGNWATCVIKSK